MTPRAFRRIRQGLGATQADVARAGGIRGNGQVFCSLYECGGQVSAQRLGQLRRGLLALRAERLAVLHRPARRARWAAQWPVCSDTRAALEAAAASLDWFADPALADWLLAARPEHASQVATGTIVHALIRHSVFHAEQNQGPRHPWDILIDAGVADSAQAIAWFDESTDAFIWEPDRAWLFA